MAGEKLESGQMCNAVMGENGVKCLTLDGSGDMLYLASLRNPRDCRYWGNLDNGNACAGACSLNDYAYQEEEKARVFRKTLVWK